MLRWRLATSGARLALQLRTPHASSSSSRARRSRRSPNPSRLGLRVPDVQPLEREVGDEPRDEAAGDVMVASWGEPAASGDRSRTAMPRTGAGRSCGTAPTRMVPQDHLPPVRGIAARERSPEAAGSPQLATMTSPAASSRGSSPTSRSNGCPSGTRSPRRVGLGLGRERRARVLLLLACGVRGCSSNLAPGVAKRQRNMSLHFTAGQCALSR